METAEPFQMLFPLLAITLKPFSISLIAYLALIIILITLSALTSGAESAYFMLHGETIKQLQKNKDWRSRQIIEFLKAPQELLASIIVANNFFNIAFIIFTSIFLNKILELTHNPTGGFLLQAGIMAFVLLLFGELLPKFHARKHPLKISRRAAPFIFLFKKIFAPFSAFLMATTKVVSRKFANIKQNITIDDLSNALNLTSHQIAEDENILKGIVKFGNIDAKEIMRSRVDVVAVENALQFDELLELIIDSGHSRIPVYEDSFDNVKGILYIKDLLPHLGESAQFQWQSLLRAPYFVPENKKINDLLKEFQTNQFHMAIVIDEYGGTNGIVTLEDILEEIVGEIADESDEDEVIYSQINESTYLFEGKTLLNDFRKILELDDEYFEDIKGDADTIAGLILEIKGEIPRKNQSINYKNLTFTIEAVDKRRIKRIRVLIN